MKSAHLCLFCLSYKPLQAHVVNQTNLKGLESSRGLIPKSEKNSFKKNCGVHFRNTLSIRVLF